MLGYILLFVVFGYILLVIHEGLKHDSIVGYENGPRAVSPDRLRRRRSL